MDKEKENCILKGKLEGLKFDLAEFKKENEQLKKRVDLIRKNFFEEGYNHPSKKAGGYSYARHVLDDNGKLKENALEWLEDYSTNSAEAHVLIQDLRELVKKYGS